MQSTAFLSRHFLSERATSVCAIPFAPGAPDRTGETITNNLLAYGAWNEEAQEHHLTLVSLVAGQVGGEISSQPFLQQLGGFRQFSKVTAVQAKALDANEVLLVSAGSDGSLCRLRMHMPTLPGSLPDLIELQEDDVDGSSLQTWKEVQHGCITAVDINADYSEVVSTSRDGTVALINLEIESVQPADEMVYSHSGGADELTCCRWALPQTFVTASTSGVLQTWDRRQEGVAVQQCSANDGALLAVSVHPAQRHICASGSKSGRITVWDLRNGRIPISSFHAAKESSCICGLQYDVTSDDPKLVFCTGSGIVGVALESGKTRCLYQEPSACIESLCVSSAGTCRQCFAVTDQEALVYMANIL